MRAIVGKIIRLQRIEPSLAGACYIIISNSQWKPADLYSMPFQRVMALCACGGC